MVGHRRSHPIDVENPPEGAAGHRNSGPSENKRRRRCCCMCLCWTVLAIVLLVAAVGATVGVLYHVFDPKIPDYSVDSLQVAKFQLSDNGTASVTFNLTVTTRNPNERIGFYYVSGSHPRTRYNGHDLCNGSFPVFYQGHRNATVLNLLLSGKAELGSKLVMELLLQQQETGTVPLLFTGMVPVRAKLGKLKLPRITFNVECLVMVDRLSLGSNSPIGIKSRTCNFKSGA